MENMIEDFKIGTPQIVFVLIIGWMAFSELRKYFKKKKPQTEIKKVQSTAPNDKFFLRRINDYWVPVIITASYIILDFGLVMSKGFLTLTAISGLQSFIYRVMILSWVLPIVQTALQIYFPSLDNYTSKEKLADFDNLEPKHRLWIYVVLVSLLSYLIAH